MALTSAQLNALPYSKTPFSSGITSDDYRAQYALHGERVRWWKAIGGNADGSEQNGMTYIEQYLPDNVRVLVSENNLEFDIPETGIVRIGDLKHSGLPDEIELGVNDRTVYPDRYRITSCTLTPGGGAMDNLPRRFVSSIDLIVLASGEVVDALKYELYGRAIRWRGTPPTEQITIRYSYNPQYRFRGELNSQAPMGSDGKRLPQIVPMHLVLAGNEYE